MGGWGREDGVIGEIDEERNGEENVALVVWIL
jgi:hypothetical protein